MRRLALSMSSLLLLLGPLAGTPAASATPITPAVPIEHSRAALPGRYIVTLKDDVSPSTVLSRLGVTPLFTYDRVLNGFAAALDAFQLRALRAMPGIAAIEEDAQVSGDATATQRVPGPAWGLDRIDQRTLPLDGQFTARRTGLGVTAYIMDTGIDYGHPEFGGRAVAGFDAMGDGRGGRDCNGHGTHVAGTVGGATLGVAPQATLVSVRVLGCDSNGTYAGMIAGFDWVARNARRPAVLNGSLGGPHSSALNNAVNALAAWGVLSVVAAGNSREDACAISPAGASSALTVGATDRGDNQAAFSNYGPCLAMFAPGVDILSARLGGGTVSLNGTSMASPHVAGIATLLKQAYPGAAPSDLKNWLTSTATSGVLNTGSTSPNLLAYTGGL